MNDEMPFSCTPLVSHADGLARKATFAADVTVLGEVFKLRAPLNRILAALGVNSIN